MEKPKTFLGITLRYARVLAFPLTLIAFVVVRENLDLSWGWYFALIFAYGFYVSRRWLVDYCRNWWATYKVLTYKIRKKRRREF